MAKPNYAFEKRQRDLEKKRKQEEKRMKKLATKDAPSGDAGDKTDVAPRSPADGDAPTAV